MAKTYGLVFTNSDPRSAPAVSLSPTIVSFISLVDGTTSAPPGITKINANTGLYLFNYTPSFPVFFLADGGTLVTDNTQRYLYGILDPVHKVDEQLTQLGSTMQAIGSTLNAIGTTNVALGTTNLALGTTNVALNTSITAQSVTMIANQTLIFSQGLTLTGYGTSTYAAALTLLAQTQTISVNLSLNIAGISLIMQAIGTTASAIGTTSVDPGDLFGYLKRLQEFNEGIQNFNKISGAWNISTRGNTLFASKTLTNSSTQVNRS